MQKLLQKISPSVLLSAAALLACVLFPTLFPTQKYIVMLLCVIGIYIIANSGLDIIYGYSGQISLGQAGFYAIGAYTSAMLSVYLKLPVLLTMFLGAALSALVALFLSASAVKLVHHFLALVTIGFAEIVRLLFQNGGSLTGGFNGINFIPGLKIFGLDLSRTSSYYYFVLVMVFLFLLLKNNLVHSKIGRAFSAIRENHIASSSFGINVPRYKMMAFAIGAFFTGFAGAMYAHLSKFISPDTFSYDLSVIFFVMVLLGGSGCLWGPIIGSVLLQFVGDYLQQFGSYQMIIYAVVIVVLVFFMPYGIAGTWSRFRSQVQRKRRIAAEGKQS